MNSLELILKEKKTLDNFLKAQRTTIAGISAEQGRFIDEKFIPTITLVADESTLDLAFEPLTESLVTYGVNRLTGDITLHPQQLAEELDIALRKHNISNPTLASTLAVLNKISLSIQDKVVGLDQDVYDESEIYEQTIMMMRLMGEIVTVQK